MITDFVDPIFYGGLIAICLFGICILQTYTYAISNDDRWPLRIFVTLLFLFVLACTLLDALVLHHYFVISFGNILELTRVTPEITIFTLLNIIVVVACDICFATRVWRLRRVHWAITAAIILTAMGSAIPGMTLVHALFKSPSITALDTLERKLEICFINILAAISQCMSAVALWYSFRAHMDEAPSNPQSVLKRLSNVIINRGALLTVDQLMLAFMFLYQPQRLFWAPFHQCIAPLYYMTMLATLNARRPQRSQTWEINNEFPLSPALLTPGALESGFNNREEGMRLRGSALRATPFPLNTAMKPPGTTEPPKRRSIPSKAVAALHNTMHRRRPRSRKSQQKDSIVDTPSPFSKEFAREHGNSEVSLEQLSKMDDKEPLELPEIRQEQTAGDSIQPRRLPPIPPERKESGLHT
ncbi:hypothetical protein PQX77_010302 [Marasmius sp. AFHP31]|nr:hypothetical protein PQX77_010302 [Marasmius sp. AFHP31]